MLLSAIKRFLSDQLKLEININKSKIFPIAQGVNTVGFKIHPTHRLLRNDSKKKVKRKVKKMKRLIGEGYLNIKKAEQMLNSWKGHADNGDSYNFIKKLLSKNDHIYLDKKNSLKINRMAVM